LFSSPELTVQRIVWPGGAARPAHNHGMWAVVGVYAGEEVTGSTGAPPQDWKSGRSAPLGLQRCSPSARTRSTRSRTSPGSGPQASTSTGATSCNNERSAWDPDGVEVRFADNSAAFRAMWASMRELAAEHGRTINDDDRYDALIAVRESYLRQRRYLSPEEVRQVVAEAWGIA
jgi:hypothetical protein